MTRHLFAAASCLALTACAWGPLRDVPEGVGLIRPNDDPATGAIAITPRSQLRKVDLIHRLDPRKRRVRLCNLDGADNGLAFAGSSVKEMFDGLVFFRTNDVPDSEVRDLQCALAAFYTYTTVGNRYFKARYPGHPETLKDSDLSKDQMTSLLYHIADLTRQVDDLKSGGAAANLQPPGPTDLVGGALAEAALTDPGLIMRRNAIQDQILATSQKVCDGFKIDLNDKITKANFAFGSIATTLAGLGAIFTDPATARGLSGASAIISGLNAEHNEAYLQSLTVKVITESIDARREELIAEINGRRYGEPGENGLIYSVSSGVKNAQVDVPFAQRPYISLSPYERALQEQGRTILKAEAAARSRKIALEGRLAAEKDKRTAAAQNQPKTPAPTANTANTEADGAPSPAAPSPGASAPSLAGGPEDLDSLNNNINTLSAEIAKVDAELEVLKGLSEESASQILRTSSVGLVPLSQYSMEFAIRDAARYHGACTITAGLEEASQSVAEIRNPGPEFTRKALQNYNQVQQAVNANNALINLNSINQLQHQINHAKKVKELNEALEEARQGASDLTQSVANE